VPFEVAAEISRERPLTSRPAPRAYAAARESAIHNSRTT